METQEKQNLVRVLSGQLKFPQEKVHLYKPVIQDAVRNNAKLCVIASACAKSLPKSNPLVDGQDIVITQTGSDGKKYRVTRRTPREHARALTSWDATGKWEGPKHLKLVTSSIVHVKACETPEERRARVGVYKDTRVSASHLKAKPCTRKKFASRRGGLREAN